MQNDFIGTVIKINGHQYTISGLIGEGASGEVYLAFNEKKQQYAIKKVYNYNKYAIKKAIDQQVHIQMMLKGNKYVIQCAGMTTNQDGFVAFIAFELGQCSLRNRLDQRKQLMHRQYFQLLMNVSQALIQIHSKKIIHRDIKPQNIIFKNGVYKLTDFGISTQKDADFSVQGTLLYFPPQIIFDNQSDDQYEFVGQSDTGNNQLDQKIDVWSLGVTAFQAYYGIHPFFYGPSNAKSIEAQQEIKKNIKILTPNFTIQKFIEHMRHLGKKQKADHIYLKKLVIKPQLVDLFGMMLQPVPSKRIDMDMVVALLYSMDGKITLPPPKVKIIKGDPPFDIQFFVNTLNIFHEVNVQLPTFQSSDIQYYLEGGIWFIEEANYSKNRWVQKKWQSKIDENAKQHKKFWVKARQCLSNYFYQLKQQKFSFFERINELRFGILIASCWNKVIFNDKPFCQKIRHITQLDIKSLEQLLQFAPLYSDKDMKYIEEFVLINLYG